MCALGFKPNKDDILKMISDTDDDENGTIEYEQILNMLTYKIVNGG